MSELRLRARRLHWLESEGEVVALDEQALTYLSANAAGTVLWQALAEGATRDELVRLILAEFDVDEATAGADVDRFLADLEARDLLERSDA
jgi:coenzyme PQQ synthesis protein D (PqqD)